MLPVAFRDFRRSPCQRPTLNVEPLHSGNVPLLVHSLTIQIDALFDTFVISAALAHCFSPSNVDPETPRRHSSPVEVSIDVASPAVAVALAKKPDLNLWRLCLGLWALMFFTSSAVTQEHSYS